MDLSNVGVAHANEKARVLGVGIDARVQDVYAFEFGTAQWDLVCLLYFIIPENHQSLYRQIATGLKPGGRVIIENPSPTIETLLEERVKWESVKLHILRLEYLEGQSDWSPRPSTFSRLLLQKPE